MQRVSEMLPQVYRQLVRENADEEALLLALWPVVVGGKVAARTRPVRLFGATLIVEAAAQDWRRQLVRMTRQIVDQLNAAADKDVVKDIEFRVAVKAEPRPPRRASSATGSNEDEAAGIADPGLRRIYVRSRRRAEKTGTKE
jgi:predicted nucleic acid-binding Zn ribbon protein